MGTERDNAAAGLGGVCEAPTHEQPPFHPFIPIRHGCGVALHHLQGNVLSLCKRRMIVKMNRLLLGLGVFNSGINPPAEALCGALLPGAFGGLPAAPSSAPTLSGAPGEP